MNTARLNQGTPLLLSAVTKQYAANTVLNQLDLHIPAGQFVAVVGRSGGEGGGGQGRGRDQGEEGLLHGMGPLHCPPPQWRRRP